MDIQEWIKKAQEANFSNEDIRHRLKSVGWTDDQINPYLQASKKSKEPLSNKKLFIILMILIVLLGLVAAAYFIYFGKEDESTVDTNSTNENLNTSQTISNTSTNTNTPTNASGSNSPTNTAATNTNTASESITTTGWKTHSNAEYGFSFICPHDLYYLDLRELESTEPLYDADVNFYLSSECVEQLFQAFSMPSNCYSIGVSLEKQDAYKPFETAELSGASQKLISQEITTLAGYAAEERSGTEQWKDLEHAIKAIYTTDVIQSPQGEGPIVYELYVVYGVDVKDEALATFDEMAKSFTISTN